eukprot:CAMPEP_0197611508 /NCGR_PEP_ID=MMETSP1326-20131121/55510_1 /TAXON_ID=1155430 /ORGANISM="Genus nov. species nov., Strain RCC2288" /LENGTH=37 /DNA_ID= /DNA_START= /DNA_END= /DNA_ORIENTATION=
MTLGRWAPRAPLAAIRSLRCAAGASPHVDPAASASSS